MITSVDDTYTDYLQHVVTDGVGVDADVVRQTLKTLGFSDLKVARILGETNECDLTTNTSSSTTTATATTASTVRRSAGSQAHRSASRSAESAMTDGAPSPHSAHATSSSTSTSSPPTTATNSNSSTGEPVAPAPQPAPASSSSSLSSSSSSSWSLLSLKALAAAQARLGQHDPHQAPLTDSTTATPVVKATDPTCALPTDSEVRQPPSHDRLARLEAMHALLVQVSLVESGASSTLLSPPSAAFGAEAAHRRQDASPHSRTTSTSMSTGTDNVDDSHDRAAGHRCVGQEAGTFDADARDGHLEPSTPSTRSDWLHEAAIATATTTAHPGTSWRQAAPPPLLTVADDASIRTGDGTRTTAVRAMPQTAPRPSARRPPPQATVPAAPAYASYRDSMARWAVSQHPDTAASARLRGIKHDGHARRPCPHQASAIRARVAATEPHVHSVSMKPSVKEQARAHHTGVAGTHTAVLPTTLARCVKSDPVALATAYRATWARQEKRVRRQKDAALWATRRRLVPTD